MTVLGIMGGSGLYDLPGLEAIEEWRGESPFGAASAPLVLGRIGAQKVAFMARHGAGHRLPPSAINYRANIDVMKRAGVTDILSLSACGSLREELKPGSFVIVDQFIDRTVDREKSFFGTGCVAHVAFADPVCSRLGDMVAGVLAGMDVPWRRGGTYLAMEGPQFSTRAESRLYRSWGADVIGMTNMPEARLAREAEICYVTVAMITDFDSWHEEFAAVDVAQVLTVMDENSRQARTLAARVAAAMAGARPDLCPAGCDRALDGALVTAPAFRDPAMLANLDAVAGRLLRTAAQSEDAGQ